MKRLLTVLILILPVCAWSQATTGFHRIGIAQVKAYGSTYVQVMPYATVTVDATATGSAATIYSDPLLTAPIPNSIVTADDNGNYDYYIPLNYCVTETVSSPGQGSYTAANICSIGSFQTLTTTGTSGASTLSGGVLNIPQYQGALTLTTTGTSGAATLIGNTLNVPNYAPAVGAAGEVQASNGSGLLESDSAITINTSTHTLSATNLAATNLNGEAIPASAALLGTNASHQLVSYAGATVTITFDASEWQSATCEWYCSSNGGTIQLESISGSPSSGIHLTITFGSTLTNAPNCVVSGYAAAFSSNLVPFVAFSNNDGFQIGTGVGPTASSFYNLTYVCNSL